MKKNLKEVPKQFEVPAEGSLGLLALGAVGLKAWRKARNESIKKARKENEK